VDDEADVLFDQIGQAVGATFWSVSLQSRAASRPNVWRGEPISYQSADWWVITFAISLLVMLMPVAPVRPIVAVQAWVGVAVDGSATIPATTPTTAISASSHRPFTACGGTVLRYREGTSTRQQYFRHHDAFEEGHVVSPTRRRTHRQGGV
jgi:hypothetical protein